VTVFEAADRIGGLLRYGIPDFKLEKHVIDRRLALLEAEGIEFRTGVQVGRDPTWSALRDAHDATILAIGAMRPRELAVPGRVLPGVLARDGLPRRPEPRVAEGRTAKHDVAGKRVIILGGGDTGSDCLGTALARAPPRSRRSSCCRLRRLERAAANPWPTWPMIFRTSSSQEEGGERTFAFRTTRLEGNGKLEALVGERVDTGEQLRLPVDTLLLALGFVGPETQTLVDQLGVALDPRGNLAVDARYATNVPSVYAAGDAHRGASLIVWAIAEGRELARHVDATLRGGPSIVPTLGQDQPFRANRREAARDPTSTSSARRVLPHH
jgi:glutamate synthase (NADPH/NADH) small chain